MTLYGKNVLVNGGFDGTSPWALAATAGGVATIADGKLYISQAVNQTANAGQSGSLVVGAEYLLELSAEILSGKIRILYGGADIQFAIGQPQIAIFTPTTTAGIFITGTNFPAEYYIDWISTRRIGVAGIFSIDMIDRDDDSRQFSLPVTQITAANHDAQLALHQALVAGVEGISKLVTRKWDLVARRTETGAAKPTAGSAQVNIEWQVRYIEDTTLEVRTVRIGGADLDISGILLPASNVADLTNTEMAAFKTAFEAVILGPNGNPVTIQEVSFLE